MMALEILRFIALGLRRWPAFLWPQVDGSLSIVIKKLHLGTLCWTRF